MANLAANNASGVSSRAGSFAYFGAGTGTSPLPIYLAYLNGSTDATQPGGLHQRRRPPGRIPTIAGRLVGAEPEPDGGGRRPRRQPDAPRPAPQAPGYPANFFVLNPDVNSVNVTDSGAFSDYHALQLELRRRLSQGLLGQRQLPVRVRGRVGSSTASASAARGPTSRHRQPTSATRSRSSGTGRCPFGRGQRFGGDMNPFAQRARRRLEHQRRRPHPDRPCRTSATSPRRHDGGRPAERCTSSTARTNADDRHRRSLDAARGRHPEHAAGVQHEQHDGRRVLGEPRRARRAGTSRRPTRRPASRSRPATARRAACCCSRRGSSGSTVGVDEAVRDRRLDEHRGAVRRAEPVRHTELQPGRQSGLGRDDLPDDRAPTPTRATPTIRAAGSAS